MLCFGQLFEGYINAYLQYSDQKIELAKPCRLKSTTYLQILRIRMRFWRVNSLTPDRHFWVFVKEIIINMIPYAGLNIPLWWSFTIFTIQLHLLLWLHVIYVTLTLKLVKVGVVRFAPIMMCATHVFKRMGVLTIHINWPIIRPWPIVMHRIKKQGSYEFYRYCMLFLCD